MEELTQKIRAILKAKFPDYSEREIDEMILDNGEAVTLRTLDKVFELLGNDGDRKIFGDFMTQKKTDEAFSFAEEKGINLEQIMLDVSKEEIINLFS